MTDNKKKIIEAVANMPEAVREKFLVMAEGAAIALDAVREEENDGTVHGGDVGGSCD